MNTTKKLFSACVFVLISTFGFAQEIKYFEAPENYQLYARDKSDSAMVTIIGKVEKGSNFDESNLLVFKDNVLFESIEFKVIEQQFRVISRIDAGLHQFRFELHFRKGKKETIETLADSVVCGDAYIVTGQSNSHASSSLCTIRNPYCRSFGVKTGYEPYSEDDKKVRWGLASGNCPELKGVGGWFKKNPYGVGIWGMELARLIVEKHQVPVCVINGGSGSSSIEENMLYPEVPSLETSFGRLAYRVDQAGLIDKVKAIFWHQGEANSNGRYSAYAESFDVLYKDWNRVYTGLERIYTFQLHPGCGYEYQSEFREVQFQNSQAYENVEIMSTTGVVGHDGCHFATEGYYEFARRIFPLVSRDFYGETPGTIITAPKLLHAFYKTEKEIILKFDQPIKMEEKYKVKGREYFMKDQFFFRMKNKDEVISNVLESIDVQDEQILLHLKNEAIFDNITWLPGKNYPGTEVCYQGPWIRGVENNLGALSFDRKTVD